MHRLALVISTAAAFAPAPRISRPLSRVGAPVPVATARVQPTLAAKLPGAEFNGCVAVQGSWLAVCVSLFLLSGVVNEKIKGQFEDENAKFRPLPPVPDTGC